MEEDIGKFIYIGSEMGWIYGVIGLLIDYNCVGVLFIEIVIKFIVGVGVWVLQIVWFYVMVLWDLLCVLDVFDVWMDQGLMCCDVNVLLKLVGMIEFGIWIEIKNVNLLKSVEVVVCYEMQCQGVILVFGGWIIQEIRYFYEVGYISVGCIKEIVEDYWYFLELDLEFVVFSCELVE